MSALEANKQPEDGTENQTVPGTGRGAIETEASMAHEGLSTSGNTGICVLSADPALVAVVQGASSADRAIVAVAEWPAVAAAIDDGRCGIVLLDMECLGETLDRRLTELERHAAAPVVLAASSIGDAPELMKALTERRIHRLLLKPASLGNTRMLLDAATNRWRQLRERDGEAAAPGAPQATLWRKAPTFQRRHGWMLGLGMSLVFAVVVVAGLVRKAPPEPETPAEPQQIARPVGDGRAEPQPAPILEPVEAPDPFADQLARADEAFEAGRLVDPPEDNALDGYAAILAVEPEHAAARTGLAATIDLLYIWAESALLGDVLELAEMTLDHVRRVRPDSARLAFMDAQVARARAAEQAAAPPPEAAPDPKADEARAQARRRAAAVAAVRSALESGDAGQAEALFAQARRLGVVTAELAELDRQLSTLRVAQQQEHEAGLLGLGLDRLHDGQLLEPESDSAEFYLVSLRGQNPGHSGLESSMAALAEALAARFQAALAEADWQGAQAALDGLGRIDADAGLVAALAGELHVARTQAEFLRVAAPANELQLLESRSLVYPDAALRSGTEGWVELEFVVDRDGRPRDITVAAAEPEGAFERAATTAVTRYRYEPFVLDGVTYERRVNLRIRFALQ
ncbi:MAG TPA: energy transducer TonB [Gammaproteobacteria bacterium]|nr:energy transducer TonB [Gammaproteobacteria bacterium]